MRNLNSVKQLLSRINLELFGTKFDIIVEYDKEFTIFTEGEEPKGRIYLQIGYHAKCNDTGEVGYWKGGKHYLSHYMTDDEIVKKAWVAFESCIKHEVMEAFLVDGKRLFNPHTHFEALLEVSHKEIKRN